MKKFTFFQIFKEIDLFGKEPDIYYKGKQRKTTWIGRICTWLYVCIYLFFFIYKLTRMFNRQDVSFSETNGSTGGLPKIHLDKEDFAYGLALSDDYGQPVLNESIYYPTAFLVGKKTINGEITPINVSIEFGICNINDFGENFKKFTKYMNLNQFYCFKNFDVDFEGYTAAENFTSIMININKCNGKTKNNLPCLDEEEINRRLNGKNLIIFSEDFELTPYNYEKPVKEKLTVNSCPIRLDQLQYFVGYYKLADIQTERNIFGFEAFSDIKSEKYIIYDSALIMAYQTYPGAPVMTYNIMLKENTLTNLRTYTQFIDILGDVGGLMEVIQSAFGVICIFVADILYDKTMVNNLFSFDLNDYTIKFKNKLNIKKELNNAKTFSVNNNDYNEEKEENSDKKTIEYLKRTIIKESEPNSKKQKRKRKIINFGKNIVGSNQICNSERVSSSKGSKVKILKKSSFHPQNDNVIKIYSGTELDIDDVNIYENEKKINDKILDEKRVIKKIDINLLFTFFCFCFVRKRKNFGNALIDEAMSIITDKLDIYNMFRNLYYIDEIKLNSDYKYSDIVMSAECKDKLKEVSNKIIDSFYKL